jgi:hypothetical protein
MLIPHGSLDAFTSRVSAHLGIPYDIIAYPGITLVDPTASGFSFIHREPGMVSRFFLVRAERPYVAPPSPPLPASDREPERRCLLLYYLIGWFFTA